MCLVRIYISLEDPNTQNVLSKTHYIGVASLDAEDVEKKITLILADLKGDGFFIKSARNKNEFIALITLLNTIGETEPHAYVDTIKAFTSETDVIPPKSDQHGFLITIQDHSSLKVQDIEKIITEDSLQYETIAETATESEHGAGDAFCQFIIALAVDLSAKAFVYFLSKLKNKLGPSRYNEIIVSSFKFVTLIENVNREKAIAKEELQIIEMRKLKKRKYEVILLSNKALLYVRCDQNANILGISEHSLWR